jgi:lipoprotein-releasing system permease protein
MLMGFVGTSIGTVLGVVISLILAKTNIIRLPADVYYIDHLPIRLDPLDIITVICAALLIVFAATLYPSHKATQLDPVDAIRYG